MFEKFGLAKSNKLIDVLNTPKQIKEGIVKDIFAIYIDPPIKERRTADKLTATQKKHLAIKDLAIQLNMSRTQIEFYLKGLNFRHEVLKAMLDDIDKINFDDDKNYLNDKLEINNNIQKTMEEIGIF